jgi:hypothetical protein
MIVIGSVVTLALFLFVGWAVSTEMFQQRSWRRRVDAGDAALVAALVEEAMGVWRRGRPPRNVASSLWAGVQGAQLLAVTEDSATLSSAADGEFRTEGGKRVQLSSALDEAVALAAKLIDMMMYDVPNLRLGSVRVDVYSTFTETGGLPVQRPILSTTATRAIADGLTWEAMTAAEILGRFETIYRRSESGQGLAVDLAPVEGSLPEPPERALPQEAV